MPMAWTPEADARLFAAFLAVTDAKINHAAIADLMGDGCTAKAIIHRIAKIKLNATSAVTTPSARTTAPSPTKKAAAKKANINPPTLDGTPIRKSPSAKKAKPASAPVVVKVEEFLESEAENSRSQK